MRRRPQTNPRRGIFRAAVAVIGLIILLILVVTAVSSLTAPTVKAPTVPPTPGPINRTPLPTPRVQTTPVATPHTTHRTGATPAPSATKPKGLSLGSSGFFDEASGRVQFRRLALSRERMVSPAVAPNGAIAYFVGSDRTNEPLLVRVGRTVADIGRGVPSFRPVWSTDSRRLLFVTVRQADGIPGASWSLEQWTARSRRVETLNRTSALGLVPLGWIHGNPAYLVAQSTASSVYLAAGGRPRWLGVVLGQPLVDAALSPNGRYIAVSTPANCGRCTLDVYRIAGSVVVQGPTGMSNGTTIAWTPGNRILTVVGRNVAVVDPATGTTRWMSRPPGLPSRWTHPMRATAAAQRAVLVDEITGQTFVAHDTAA